MNTENENRIPTDLIAKAITGEAGSDDLEKLQAWIDLSEENRKLYEQYRSLWQRSGFITPVASINVDDEWKRFRRSSSQGGNKGRTKTVSMAARYAAAASVVVIISLSLLLGYMRFSWKSVSSAGSIASVELPDGSDVTLYPGSTLKYKRNKGSRSREVRLAGEAFFTVARDTLRPFTVSSGELLVRVLGTSFNVEAFEGSERFSVIVEEGIVEVKAGGDDRAGEILKMGDMLTYTPATGAVMRGASPDPNYASWRTGKLLFENAPLGYVAASLSKTFNRSIVVSSAIETVSITVTFENSTLDYILSTLEATLDITVKHDGERIILE